MVGTIKFQEIECLCLEYCGSSHEGVSYLRFVGEETVVMAIWSRLVAKDYREKAYSSEVTLHFPGQEHPENIALQKWVYKTLRARLPSGYIDLALIHPLLTITEDDPSSFYILTYDSGIPAGFFERLNKSLALPLNPEWATWLWEAGQQSVSIATVETKTVNHGEEEKQERTLKEQTLTPILQSKSRGQARIYMVQTGHYYKTAWLQLIREQLGLGIPMHKPIGDPHRYVGDGWDIDLAEETESGKCRLYKDGERQFVADSLTFLVAQAHTDLGIHLQIPEVNHAHP